MKKLISIFLFLIICIPNIAIAENHDFRFKNVYNKAFYKNPWITGGLISAAAAAAAVFVVYTGGAGAPIAGTGVSTISSWLAGGGAGSYMAGLSILGNTFGGNAILGAAILNGASAATIGGVAGKGLISTASKLALGVLAAGEIAILLGEDGVIYGYSIVIPMSKKIGGDLSKQIVDRMAKMNKDLEEEKISTQEYLNWKSFVHKSVIRNFRSKNTEDAIVSVMVLHNLGYIDDFIKYTKKLPEVHIEKNSFIFYLKSIASLLDGNYKRAQYFSNKVMIFEPKVLEAVLINAIANFNINRKKFGEASYSYKTEIDNFSNYYYTTPNSKLNGYLLLANLSEMSSEEKSFFRPKEKSAKNALKFYELSFKETSLIGDKEKKASICASIGNAHYRLGNRKEAKEYYNKAIGYSDKNVDIESTFNWVHWR
jgi:tetratricopeptide (TPR) repeat protein